MSPPLRSRASADYLLAGVLDPLSAARQLADRGPIRTVAIAGEGWIDHTAEQLPRVPAVCEAA